MLSSKAYEMLQSSDLKFKKDSIYVSHPYAYSSILLRLKVSGATTS